MRLTMELKIRTFDENGDTVTEREPTAEEFDEFFDRFGDMEDAGQDREDGLLWLLDRDNPTEEEFDFIGPTREISEIKCPTITVRRNRKEGCWEVLVSSEGKKFGRLFHYKKEAQDYADVIKDPKVLRIHLYDALKELR